MWSMSHAGKHFVSAAQRQVMSGRASLPGSKKFSLSALDSNRLLNQCIHPLKVYVAPTALGGGEGAQTRAADGVVRVREAMRAPHAGIYTIDKAQWNEVRVNEESGVRRHGINHYDAFLQLTHQMLIELFESPSPLSDTLLITGTHNTSLAHLFAFVAKNIVVALLDKQNPFSLDEKYVEYRHELECAETLKNQMLVVKRWCKEGIINLYQLNAIKMFLSVTFIDAHADLHSPATSPSGNVHGMFNYLGRERSTLINSIEFLDETMFEILSLKEVPFVMIGQRSVEDAEKIYIDRNRNILSYPFLWPDNFSLKKVLKRADDDLHALREAQLGCRLDRNKINPIQRHLEFDIDVLRPEDADGAGTVVEGGFSAQEAQAALMCAGLPSASTYRYGSISVVEMGQNPGQKEDSASVKSAVGLIQSLYNLYSPNESALYQQWCRAPLLVEGVVERLVVLEESANR